MDTISPSFSSSSIHMWKYGVFLSFRGENTRYNFTDLWIKRLSTPLEMMKAWERKAYITCAFKSNRRLTFCYCCSLKKLCIINMVFGWTCEDHGMRKKDWANSSTNFLQCRSIWGAKTDGNICASVWRTWKTL